MGNAEGHSRLRCLSLRNAAHGVLHSAIAASAALPPRTVFAVRHPWISSVPCAVFAAALCAAAGLRPVFVGLIWFAFFALSLVLLAARRRSMFHDERPAEEQRSVEPRSNVRPMA